MAIEWYYTQAGERQGPVSGAQLKELASSGRLSPTDLIWKDGMVNWAPASSLKGLLPPGTCPTINPEVEEMPTSPLNLGSWVTPKRALVAGGALVGFVLILAIGALFTSPHRSPSRGNSDMDGVGYRTGWPAHDDLGDSAADVPEYGAGSPDWFSDNGSRNASRRPPSNAGTSGSSGSTTKNPGNASRPVGRTSTSVGSPGISTRFPENAGADEAVNSMRRAGTYTPEAERNVREIYGNYDKIMKGKNK